MVRSCLISAAERLPTGRLGGLAVLLLAACNSMPPHTNPHDEETPPRL